MIVNMEWHYRIRKSTPIHYWKSTSDFFQDINEHIELSTKEMVLPVTMFNESLLLDADNFFYVRFTDPIVHPHKGPIAIWGVEEKYLKQVGKP